MLVARMPTMNNFGLLLLRLTIGIGLMWHGYDKVLNGGVGDIANMVTDWGWPIPSLFAWAAGLSELVGGTLLLLGLYTRYAAIPVAVTMGVALIQVHWGNPFETGGETALLYLVGSLTFLFCGPGDYAID